MFVRIRVFGAGYDDLSNLPGARSSKRPLVLAWLVHDLTRPRPPPAPGKAPRALSVSFTPTPSRAATSLSAQ